jgi:hypothetical protein
MSGRVVTNEEIDWSRYDNCMRVKVVGESHYQDALKRVSECPPTGDHRYECAARLVLEPDNPHDRFAVRVEVDGRRVGYLPRGSAKRFNKRLRAMAEQGQPAICMAFIGRSEDAGHSNLGINLRLPYDGEILQGEL